MPSQHSQAEASLRLLAIEKIKTSELELEIEDEKEMQAAEATEVARPRHEYTSTLIEFPAKRPKSPEWRDELKNRVKLAQERRRSENVQQAEEKQKSEKAVVTPTLTEPALVINLVPNISEQRPTQKLLARALERIERSRQNFDSYADEEEPAEFDSNELNQLQMAQVSAKNEARTTVVDSPLSLVGSKSEASPSSSALARKVLPLIEDESVSSETSTEIFDLENESQSSAKFEQRESFQTPQNVWQKNKTAAPEVFEDFEDDETIAASLHSVRKTTVIEQTLAAQQPLDRTSNAGRAAREVDDYAPLLQRFMGGCIDAGLGALLTIGISVLLGLGKSASFNLSTILGFFGLFAPINFLYLIPALMLTGTTLGLRCFRMQIVAVEDGMVPTLTQAIYNTTAYLLSLMFGGLPLLTVFFSSEKRALHDLIAKTVVVVES